MLNLTEHWQQRRSFSSVMRHKGVKNYNHWQWVRLKNNNELATVCMKEALAKLTCCYEDMPPTAERLRKENGMQEEEICVAAYQYTALYHADLQLKYV
jgi:hypothetical protein